MSKSTEHRLAIFISGGGTTMAEIIRATQSGEIPNLTVVCVFSNNKSPGGFDKARALGIPEDNIVSIGRKQFTSPDGIIDQIEYGTAILQVLQDRGVTVVTQNGFMPQTPANVIDTFKGRIFNQHPGFTPELGGWGMFGLRVHAAAIALFHQFPQLNRTRATAQRAHREFDQGAEVMFEDLTAQASRPSAWH